MKHHEKDLLIQGSHPRQRNASAHSLLQILPYKLGPIQKGDHATLRMGRYPPHKPTGAFWQLDSSIPVNI